MLPANRAVVGQLWLHNARMNRRHLLLIGCLPALLHVRAPVAAQDPAPLVEAAGRGDLARVQALLGQGVLVDQRDGQQRTALVADALGRHWPVALHLVAAGADVNAQDAQRDSGFLIACREGPVPLVRATLAAGADLRSTNRYGSTALFGPAYRGHLEVVRLLLATPIALEHVNSLGWTVLLETIALGQDGPVHQAIVRLLLERGARADARDREGVSALALAQQKGQHGVAQLLRQAGAR